MRRIFSGAYRSLRTTGSYVLTLARLCNQLGFWRFVRLPWLFWGGLIRTFRVWEQGKYTVGVGGGAVSNAALAAVHDRKALLDLIWSEFVCKTGSVYVAKDGFYLFFGGTRNNEREFFFLSRLSESLNVSYSRSSNLSFSDPQRCSDSQRDFIIKLILFRLVSYFSNRLAYNPISAGLLLAYCKYFYRFFNYFLRSSDNLPKFAVVANDHSASAVAFASVTKLFNVLRIYLQHAEVSPRFPPLDFEYSVLRNERSAQIYRKIGKPTGRVYVVAREPRSAQFEKIFQSPSSAVEVVIYLTAVFVPERVRGVVELLERNPAVLGVKLKIHPRTSVELRNALSDKKLLTERYEVEHIAVVGNSSVAIELLSAGIKVFQLFSLDEIARDYYGFVADGLTAEVAESDLLCEFWKRLFYTQAWQERMASYDPALGPASDDSERLIRDLAAELPPVR